jgi:hypothetical protein
VVSNPAFGDRKRAPVSSRFDGHEMQSNGLAFEDYARMRCTSRKLDNGRRLATPEWATADIKTRALIVRFMELRAGFRKPTPGPEHERLQRAQKSIMAEKPNLLALLHKLCAEYVVLKRDHVDLRRQRALEIQIQNVDTRLCLLTRGPALIAGIIFCYYRLGLDSCGVSAHLDGVLKPPSVRRTLWKLTKTWERMQSEPAAPVVSVFERKLAAAAYASRWREKHPKPKKAKLIAENAALRAEVERLKACR